MRIKHKNGETWLKLQTAVCIVLMAVMLAVSIIPLYSVEVKVPSSMQSAMDNIVDILNEMPDAQEGDGDIEIKLPKKLNVDLLLIIRVVSQLDELKGLYSGVMTLSNIQQAKTPNEYHQAYNDLRILVNNAKELVQSSDFTDAIALVATVVSGFSQSRLAGTVMVLMASMSVVLPIILLGALVRALIGFAAKKKDPEKRYLWVMRTFRRAAKSYLIVLAIGLLDSKISLSRGIIIGLGACVLGFAFCAVASRGKDYSPIGRKYQNLLQIISIGELVGFFSFYFCLAKTGIVGQYATIIAKNAVPYIRSKAYGVEFLKQYLFMLLALAGLVTMIVSLSMLSGTLSKLGGVVPRNKDSNIFAASCTLALIIIVSVADVIEKKIELSPEGIAFMVVAAVSALAMVGFEIVFKLLRNSDCQGLKESEKHAILTGLDAVETEMYNEEDN